MDFVLHPLNLVTFSPLLGVLILFFIKPEKKEVIRWVALITSLVTFGISLWILNDFQSSDPNLQFVINLPWIQVAGWNISYYMAMDGLSVLLVMLTTFLTSAEQSAFSPLGIK